MLLLLPRRTHSRQQEARRESVSRSRRLESRNRLHSLQLIPRFPRILNSLLHFHQQPQQRARGLQAAERASLSSLSCHPLALKYLLLSLSHDDDKKRAKKAIFERRRREREKRRDEGDEGKEMWLKICRKIRTASERWGERVRSEGE